MLIKILFLALIITFIFIGIKILIKCLPGVFGRENLESFKRVATHLADQFPATDKRTAVGKILTQAGAVLAVEVVKKEQVGKLRQQILPLKKFLTTSREKIRYFLYPLTALEQKIASWEEQLVNGSFDFLVLKAEIGFLRLIVSQNRLLFREIEELFFQSYELLGKAKEARGDQEQRNSVLELEAALANYANAPISFGDLNPFFELKENLQKIIAFLGQCLEAERGVEPTKTPFVDYYKILGVNHQASAEEIKKAWRQATMKNHPDKKMAQLERLDDGELKAEVEKIFNEKVRLIQEAYEVLSDAAKRAEYNRQHSQKFS